MSTAELSNVLLNWVIAYGPAALPFLLFLGAAGLPLPGTFLVMAAGALARQGVIDPLSALLLTLLAVAAGDVLGFGAGRLARTTIHRRFSHTSAWGNAERTLVRRGGTAIFLTRWLLTPLAVPTNLVAGSGGYSLRSYLAFDVAGELTWLLLFGGAGYVFSGQWEAISQLVSDSAGLLIAMLVLIAGAHLILRGRRLAPIWARGWLLLIPCMEKS